MERRKSLGLNLFHYNSVLLIIVLGLLAVVLSFALLRPRGWTEAVAAVPAAAILIAIGAVSVGDARDEVSRLLPVVGFLAAVLVLAQLCDDEGVFHAAGQLMSRRSAGAPKRLMGQVFVIASVTTAVLSLDATIVLLTPVVLASARMLRLPSAPHAYASAHLANTASLLLPVSNLTNLLAFGSAGLSFTRFAVLMAVPWVVAIAAEYLIFRWFFSSELSGGGQTDELPPQPTLPVFALVVLALTLAGFAVASLIGIAPAWVACAGAAVLAVRGLLRRRGTIGLVARAVNVPFLAFVLALGIVVRAAMDNGLGTATRALLPSGEGLFALLALAAIAAVLANIVNNLPAVLLLLPLVSGSGAAAVLAVLIGVNVGSNLTYVGSLSNLLWRNVLRDKEVEATFSRFTRLGICTVPITLVLAVLALWAGVQVIGT
ncbi:MAG: arsenical pump rane protein [Mycobacterium sp.]|nr:arsenical pump rane protein [Mycobacterium sp.]